MSSKERPPRPRKKTPRKTEQNWRDAYAASSLDQRRSSGIAPSQFHSSTSRSSSESLSNLLETATSNTIKQKRTQVTTELKLKRAAYKEVTSLKTWPLQDMAFRDLDYWRSVHYNEKEEEDNTDYQQQQSPLSDVETHGDSTGLSSSSLEEPKRVRRQQLLSSQKSSSDGEALSPRKSTLRYQYKMEFLLERDIPRGVSINEQQPFQSALWCMEPRIFAVEKSSQGKRKYMVGHMGRFCDYYWRKTDRNARHWYELIPENTPCRLFFDLEFHKKSNADIDPEKLLQEYMEELINEFDRHYGIKINRSCIVDLDSSTDKKMSRHWIVHLPNHALFRDAAAAGRFVRVLIGRLAEGCATGQLQETRPTLAKHLFVNVEQKHTNAEESAASPSGESETSTPEHEVASSSPQASSVSPSLDLTNKTCFVDMGVYTRNRLFRLLGSSKFGKPPSAALRIASTNEFAFPQGFSNESFYVPDMEQSRGKENTGAEEKKVDMEKDIQQFLSAVDWTDHATALVDTLVVPMNGSKIDYPILDDSQEAKDLEGEDLNGGKAGQKPSSVQSRTNRNPSLSIGASPYPAIDEFVLNTLGKRGGVEGAIRAWSVEESNDPNSTIPRSITYQMSRNRWCERIGRAHRSNNVMWTVDLVSMSCTQSCHDPECRMLHYRGIPVPLPDDVREGLMEEAFEQQLARLDEQALLESRPMEDKDEFDDAEFEKALLALNLNDQTQCQTEHETASAELSAQNTTSLDDDALLGAMLTNPDMFP